MRSLNRTRVKICGITSLSDAISAIEAGADAIGFVFFEKSPRFIDIKNAEKIVQNIAPFINCVGLFVNADQAYVKEMLKYVAIDTLQFHGQETEQDCALYGKPYIKAVRMSANINLFQQVAKYPSAKAILLDTYVKNIPGGTGKLFEWDRIPKDLDKPIILAGGLNSDNVKDAILKVSPYAVDVSGGVESAKGEKEHHKMIKFIRQTLGP